MNDSKTVIQAEYARKELKVLRQKLLDLSMRNRLLNFKHNNRSGDHVRIIDGVLEFAFKNLLEGNEFEFEALPESKSESISPKDEHTPKFRTQFDELSGQNEYKEKLSILDAKLSRDNDVDSFEQSLTRLERSLKDSVRELLGLPDYKAGAIKTEVDWAKANGINPSYALLSPEGVSRKSHTDKKLQTLLMPDSLNAKLASINDKKNYSENEKGVNTLYAAFGFLEWSESKSSDKRPQAPIILLQLELEKSFSRGRIIYKIKSVGDDPIVNETLRVRLQNDGIDLPEFDPEIGLEDYLEKVLDIISEEPEWVIHRYLTIGHFAFHRLAMYHDLDPEKWSDDIQPHDLPLIRQLLGGNVGSSSESDYLEIYNPDDSDFTENPPNLILDADSSQFSAVVDVLNGKNLVIQGPPGTGKSQTIANIIGAAMGEGKKVLFVAEKMSALDVVKKRLDANGIGEHCLELHSTKSRRSELMEVIRNRLLKPPPGRPEHRIRIPSTSKDNILELRRCRDRMKRYLDILKKEVGQTGVCVEDALWISKKIDYSAMPVIARQFRFSKVRGIKQSDILNIKNILSELHELTNQYRGYISDSPWFFLRKQGVSRNFIFDVEDHLKGVIDVCEKTINLKEEFESRSGKLLPSSIDQLEKQSSLWRKLPSPSGNEIALASFIALSRRPLRIEAQKLYAWENSLQLSTKALREYAPSLDLDKILELKTQVEILLSIMREYALPGIKNVTLQLELSNLALSNYSKANSIFLSIDGYLEGINCCEALDDFNGILFLLEHAQSFPDVAPVFYSPSLASTSQLDEVTKMQQLYESINAALVSMKKEFGFTFSCDTRAVELSLDLSALEQKTLFSFLSFNYRGRINHLRSLYDINLPKLDECSRHLREIIPLVEKLEELKRNPLLDQFSISTSAKETLNHMKLVSEWFNSARREVKLHKYPFNQQMLSIIEGRAWAVFDRIRKEIGVDQLALLKSINNDLKGHGIRSLSEYVGQLGLITHKVKECLSALDQRFLSVNRTRADLEGFQRNISQHLGLIESLDAQHVVVRDCLNEFSSLRNADLASGLAYYDELSDSSTLNLNNVEFDDASYGKYYSNLRSLHDQCIKLESDTDHFFKFVDYPAWGCRDVSRIKDAASQLLETSGEINKVSEWHHLIKEVQKSPCSEIHSLISPKGGSSNLADSVESLYGLSLSVAMHEDIKELVQFSGQSLTKDRNSIREIDDSLKELSVQAILETLHSEGRNAPTGISYGSKKSFTEMSLIRHQINLTKPSMAPRRLIAQSRESLSKLFPCFMMSPLSVSEYINRSDFKFDLVVYDEASQIKPEDALGAMLRANQFVVVGDEMQLPPTSFFNTSEVSLDDDLDDEDMEDINAAESILEKANTSFGPPRMLGWHYRSRHPSLIAYSNREFYDDRLNVFPAPFSENPKFGIKSHYVEGVYLGQSNLLEAEKIVAGVVSYILEEPDNSIGIVAMNEKQRELISGLLDQEFAESEAVNAYRLKWKATLEPIFVKNLENVQGDERDAIFISTVYGKNPQGAMYQRFGPINQKKGHRRLNVLFTRAKKSIQLYTSLTPEDVLLDEQSARGKRVFKEFLEYARSGRLESGKSTMKDPDSEFEIQVGEALRSAGYECDYQVGVTGFFIDLAVKHPAMNNHYILGIECDGAKYHSFKSARDRDRLRQDVLEGLGWEIYRIWSTDWFKDKDDEVKKLVKHLKLMPSSLLGSILPSSG